jgi:hypothetical protein
MKIYKYSDTYQVPVLEWKDLEKLGIKSEDINWSTYAGSNHRHRYSEDKMMPGIIATAERIWLEEWIAQGRKDEGTCTGGNAIQVQVIPKRKISPYSLNLACAPRVQGNVSKAASMDGALKFINDTLKSLFGDQIKASYYDGWMD